MVSATGFGSEAAMKAAWANLAQSGWTPDDAFWQGLETEVEVGMARFNAGGCVPLSAVAGGALWLNERRWERALARKSMHAVMAEAGLAQVQPMSKQAAFAEALRKQNAAVDKLLAREAAKEAAKANDLTLEKAHGF